MKQLISILVLISCSLTSNGQTYSRTIDSLTNRYVKQLSRGQQLYIDSILVYRQSTAWLKRLDTTRFDYAFVEERFCYAGASSMITELYFSQSDTIPKSVFMEGEPKDPKKIYDGFLIWYSKNVTHESTLFPLIEHYSKLKAIQELPYDKRQIWSHGCVVQADSEAKFKAKRTEELKTTFQIQTMVDRVNNKIVVSVQVAPKRPRFEVRGYNAVWDW